ncbi:hypothetical protein F7725_025767 [Dissostichus mawsoni]|uniref:Uncharacterized protein n=1 Tax=Dissostichus mawsoni TaxID=36200 RepID=A0A7J5X571_DISMA|nr:hypothetical protein F7725_025767 [Dissostichus mawsoni]
MASAAPEDLPENREGLAASGDTGTPGRHWDTGGDTGTPGETPAWQDPVKQPSFSHGPVEQQQVRTPRSQGWWPPCCSTLTFPTTFMRNRWLVFLLQGGIFWRLVVPNPDTYIV